MAVLSQDRQAAAMELQVDALNRLADAWEDHVDVQNRIALALEQLIERMDAPVVYPSPKPKAKVGTAGDI